ncbi:MAG: methionine biosynthesis protein MetW [Caldilineaceae bacterium]|jgi:methionine biosynthesis protein MetW|nr:methionine biosynthesis protein MetW [Caldilineaceae bacterium]
MSNQPLPSPAEVTRSPRLRPDLLAIADLVEPGARMLDLGCGDGALLEYLRDRKQVKGRGIELTEAGVLACVRRGLSVRQGNVQEGLADYPDQSFDAVILSQTLPYLDDPAMVLGEMLRVGRTAIVSFSNWGHWRCRLELLVTGRIPVAVDLPQQWYESPRRQLFSVTDFARFCREIGIVIDRQIYMNRGVRIRTGRFKNLLSTTAVFTLQKRAKA